MKKRRVIIITIDPNKLDELSIDINNLQKEYKETVSKINSTIINIGDNNIWQGKDNIEFTNAYNTYKIYLDKVESLLLQYSNYFKNISSIYKVIEEDYSTKNIDE